MTDNFKSIRSIKDLTNVFINIIPIFFKTKKELGIFSMCAYRFLKEDKKTIYEKYAQISDDKYKIKTLFKKGLGFSIGKYVYYFNIYTLKIDTNRMVNYPPQNVFLINFTSKTKEIVFPVVYNFFYYKKYLGKVGPLFKYKNKYLVY